MFLQELLLETYLLEGYNIPVIQTYSQWLFYLEMLSFLPCLLGILIMLLLQIEVEGSQYSFLSSEFISLSLKVDQEGKYYLKMMLINLEIQISFFKMKNNQPSRKEIEFIGMLRQGYQH